MIFFGGGEGRKEICGGCCRCCAISMSRASAVTADESEIAVSLTGQDSLLSMGGSPGS